jgi:hypothetical protein
MVGDRAMTQRAQQWKERGFAIKYACALLGFLSLSSSVFACSCLWSGPFTKVMLDRELVIRVEVTKLGGKLPHGETLHKSMTVTVKEVLKGKTDLSSIEVLGDPGHLCLVYIDTRHFQVGREYLLALSDPMGDEAPLRSCGEHWVAVNKDKVEGVEWVDEKRVR